jgi:hypothetical protein
VPQKTRVYIEAGGKKTFASAADWPGWSRSGKDEQSALDALAAYAPRYAKVARLARVDFPGDATDFEVIERLAGSASTDFGVPGMAAKNEKRKPADGEMERLLALLDACWKYLDQVRARVPEELRKGPRGGGRDREKMYRHVVDAEVAYAAQVGLKLKQPDRKALRDALQDPKPDTRWPIPYAVRRTAWHALDHAWEMEDRIP